MNCRQANERISAHLDGELAPREAENMRRHLASCASCRAIFEQLQRTVRAVKDLPVVPAPGGFHARVMSEIESLPSKEAAKQSAAPRRVPGWRMLWPAAAAVLIAVVLALISDRPRPVPMAKHAEKPSGAGAEPREAKGEATMAPTDERMRRTDAVPAPPQAVLEALDGREKKASLTDRERFAAAKPEDVALEKESLRAGAAAADAVEEVHPAETPLAFAREETDKAGDSETWRTSVGKDGSEVWTVVTPDPDAALARLDAVALERRWKIPPKQEFGYVKEAEAAVPRIVLNVPANQLPTLAQVVKTLAEPPGKALSVGRSRNGRIVGELAAPTAPAAAAHAAETQEPKQPALADRAIVRKMDAAVRETVRVTVYFQPPQALGARPATDADVKIQDAPPKE